MANVSYISKIKLPNNIVYEVKDASLDGKIAQEVIDRNAAIAEAIAGVTQFDYQVVQTLPESGVKGTIYLVPKTPGTQDVYDEFIWVNNSWEHIGSTQIDLSNYVQDVSEDAPSDKAYARKHGQWVEVSDAGGMELVTNPTANDILLTDANGQAIDSGVGFEEGEGIDVTTSVTSSSTNDEIPSAKAVYDALPFLTSEDYLSNTELAEIIDLDIFWDGTIEDE